MYEWLSFYKYEIFYYFKSFNGFFKEIREFPTTLIQIVSNKIDQLSTLHKERLGKKIFTLICHEIVEH